MTTTQPAPTSALATSNEGFEAPKRKTRGSNPVFWVAMVLISLIFIVPLLFMVLTSFKSAVEARSVPPTFLPESPSLRAYNVLFFSDAASPVLRWLLNSFIAASAHAVLVVVICAMAGYAFAKMDFPGKKFLFGCILATLFVPAFVFLMPNFLTLNALDWLDTLWALIVPGAAGAFGVFFMRQFFSTMPVEFEESARIDGASPWTIFTRIILPNARPALVTLLVLSFLANWNDFIWPLYVLFTPSAMTLQVGLSKLQGAYSIDYPVVMAGATIAAIPVLILFVFVQRFVIEGVASSGVKG